MKKIIILFLLFTAANSYGQYFGEKTTYLTNTNLTSGPPPYAYYSTFKHLQYINQDSMEENYVYWVDTINGFSPFAKPEIRQLNVRNDSIFVNDQLIFINNLSQGDSFSLTMNGPGETVFYIDSVYVANGIKQTQFTTNKKFNFPGFYGDFLWVEGVGEIRLGLVDFLEFGLITINIGLSYKAYCKDNSNPKNMDGSAWTESEDDCMFESYIEDRRRRTNVDTYSINQIKCFPNPAKDKLYLEGGIIEFYQITNTSGQEILSGRYQEGIDISSLSMGIYFIEAIVDENVLRSRFLVR